MAPPLKAGIGRLAAPRRPSWRTSAAMPRTGRLPPSSPSVRGGSEAGPSNFYSGQPMTSAKERKRPAPKPTARTRRPIVIKNAQGEDVRRTHPSPRAPPSLPFASASPAAPASSAAAGDPADSAAPAARAGGGSAAAVEDVRDGLLSYSTPGTRCTPAKKRSSIKIKDLPLSHATEKARAEHTQRQERQESHTDQRMQEDEAQEEPEPVAVDWTKQDMFAVDYKPPSLKKMKPKQSGKTLFFGKVSPGLESRIPHGEQWSRAPKLKEELDKIARNPKSLEQLRVRARLAGVPNWRLDACESAVSIFDCPRSDPKRICEEVRKL